jgi:hypothetical protein
MPTFGNGDVYIHWAPSYVFNLDKVAIQLHATRADLIKYFVQEGLKNLDGLSKEEHHKLMRSFENGQALDKAPEANSDVNPASEF